MMVHGFWWLVIVKEKYKWDDLLQNRIALNFLISDQWKVGYPVPKQVPTIAASPH